MSLTTPQLQTLKAAIAAEADPTFVGYRTNGQTDLMAGWYNQPTSPAFVVWRTAVTPIEWRAAIIGGGGASQLDALTASKRDSLLWAVSDTLNPPNSNVRAALDDFCGSQNTLKAAILAAQKRPANKVEKLYATGTGSDGSPGTLVFEGSISGNDISQALNLP